MSEEGEDGWTAYGPVSERGMRAARMPLSEARQKAARERELTEQRFANAPFPLYGLPPSWTGGRFLGGGSWGSTLGHEIIHAMSLVHGVLVEGQGPILVVETTVRGRSAGGRALRTFAEFLWTNEATPSEAMEMLRERTTIREHDDLSPLPLRGHANVSIDERPVSLDVVFGTGVWVGRASVGSNDVTVEGRDFELEGLQLVQVRDLDPYIVGTRRFETGRP
jgi:hypothetical protein